MSRRKPGKERIEAGLLRLLGNKPVRDVTVTELCAQAQVSRSTFYAHFANVDEVYRSLVRQLIFDTSAMSTQLRAGACADGTLRKPLCALVRDSAEYRGLVNDDAFIPTYFEMSSTEFHDETLGVYLDICPDEETAQALCRFQIMGCIAAAKAADQSADWERVKATLDTFIRGGLNAVRQANG